MAGHITNAPIVSRMDFLNEGGHLHGVMMRWADVTFTFMQGGVERSLTLGMPLPLRGDQSAAAYAGLKEILPDLAKALDDRITFNAQFTIA